MSSGEESHMSEDDSANDMEIVQEYETAAESKEQDLQPENENNEQDLNEDEQKDKKETKTKRVRNPQPKLNIERLRGPRGLRELGKIFERLKFRGSGYEQDDLNLLLKNYEYWCHRMFPKFPFDNCIERIEKLGHKKFLQTYIRRIRMNLEDEDDDVNKEQANDETNNEQIDDEIVDKDSEDATNFDSLITTPAVEPTNPSPPMLSEEQLRIIAINREKALKLRAQLLNKNTTVSKNDDKSRHLEQDITDSESSNNSIRPSQLTIQAESDSCHNDFSTNGDCDEELLKENSRDIELSNNNSKPTQFTVQAEIHSCNNGFSTSDDDNFSQQNLKDLESSNSGTKPSQFTVEAEIHSCSNKFAEVDNTPNMILPNDSQEISILSELEKSQRENALNINEDLNETCNIKSNIVEVINENISICDFEDDNFSLHKKSVPDGDINSFDTNVIQKEVDVNEDNLLMEVDI